MSETFRPTPEQQACVDTEGGGIIVSAAAGSGKTRVLVQRVIRLLTSKQIPADRLLVLTFTNAAAAEMRTRITAALDDLIRTEPKNSFYRRQQLLLGSADICTVHSFCSKLVRENFFRFGIRRDFRIDENQDIEELKVRLMSELIEELYREGSASDEQERAREQELHEGFETLSLVLTGQKMDRNLEESLLSAYQAYMSNAFPEVWLRQTCTAYDPALPLEKSPHFRFLAELVSRPLLRDPDAQLGVIDTLSDYFEDLLREKKAKSYESALEALAVYRSFLLEVKACAGEDGRTLADPLALCRLMQSFQKITVRSGNVKDETLKGAFARVNRLGDFLKKACQSICIDVEAYEQDNRQLYPAVRCLAHLLTVFDRRLFEAKAEKGVLEFHDLENLTMKLLYEEDPESGQYRPSELAKELSGQYDEIMVDEYQDTNDIQEQIFKALSRNEDNLFMVGDIKQSIYSFRQAEPRLFKERCARSVKMVPGDTAEFPARIILDRNFRSRPEIIDCVNYVFGLLMSEESSQIEYNEEEMLVTGASYAPGDGYETEFHLVEYSAPETEGESDEEDPDKLRTEGAYCAKVIEEIMQSGLLIGRNAQERRPVRYGDFCILLRKVTGVAHVYSGELERRRIPAYTGTDFNLLTQYEVRSAVSYLKLINNPLSDIDLSASLLCPVFGFTPDDVVLLRRCGGKTLYNCLLTLTSSPKEPEDPALASLKKRLSEFQQMLADFRLLAVTVPSDRLLSMVFEKTGWLAVMRTMNGGELRTANLLRLRQFAADYESASSGGLSGFVRRLRYLEESGEGILVSDAAPPDAVRIMTIHSSKGLEFPICLLAGLDGRLPGNRDKLQSHSTLGIGLQAADPRTLLHYHTLQENAIRRAKEQSEKWEMLRVLYVAMTRPMEKLIMIQTVKSGKNEEGSSPFAKYLSDIAKKISIVPDGQSGGVSKSGRMDPYVVQEHLRYDQLLTMCALVQEGMDSLREDAGAGADDLPLIPTACPWRYVPVKAGQWNAGSSTASKDRREDRQPPDEAIMRKLEAIFAKSEKALDPTTMVPSKVSASVLAHKGIDPETMPLQTPEFMQPQEGTAAERGTAAHTLLHYAELEALASEIRERGTIEKEKQRILGQNLMTERQMEMLRDEDIIRFTQTTLFERMLRGKRLYREYRFTVEIPGSMAVISKERAAGMEAAGGDWGKSIMQGAIDCLIEEEDGMVIVDYKTDRIKQVETLVRRYEVQVKLYRKAVEEMFEKPVKACILYSLPLGEEITVE